ncbi:serum paraoxonase/arylesterase 2-like [Brienomyrus brachyistius]|uniref:serum paraoxonase/arylesterase 2-like n=1 Tax=Brienomyrus brachyistius TaxID=42636 RepID=UPI0020B40100|nr:serum paraoxonase/arylesterase 2-like [Brienomyrus brachyistius]
MGKLLIVFALITVFVAFLGERIITLRKVCLASREVIPNHLPNCRHLKGLEYGSEDITVLPHGLAIISTGLKYPGVMFSPDSPGKIYTVDLHDPRLKPVELKIAGAFDVHSFNPHGIGVYIDEKDHSVYLFVVNHPRDNSQVEVFRFVEEDNSIVHLNTIQHELLYSVNDVVPVGADRFYATNDHYFSNAIMKRLEPVIGRPWTNVVYYSPDEVKVVAEGFFMANGINSSPDKRHIYVADIFDHKIYVMAIQENKNLTVIKSVDAGSLCDNVEVDLDTGDLWLGCFPNGWKMLHYDPEDPPGCEVIQIQNVHSEKPIVKQVYCDNGSIIQGCSVSAFYRDKLLIGTVFHKTLACDMK